MLKEIEQHQHQLEELCRRFAVRRLELFGSGVRGDFDPSASDLDFLVLFRDDDTSSAADQYLGLHFSMEVLFNRKVDLVDVRASCNPYFMAEALKQRVLLYAA